MRTPNQRASNRPGWLENWLERHQSRVSFWLHAVGIPLAVAALPLAAYQLFLWRWDLWYRPASLLLLGYLLQYLGHRYEGNDMGEVILVKRWLGKPYIAISPRFSPAAPLAGGKKPIFCASGIGGNASTNAGPATDAKTDVNAEGRADAGSLHVTAGVRGRTP